MSRSSTLSEAVLRSDLFADFESWMIHGFGLRDAVKWPPVETATLKQIHSGDVIAVRGPCAGELGEGDALITATQGVTLSIRTADCVPLLFADPVRRVVAATHAGWRGTALRIATATVEKMVLEFGSEAKDIRVAIGPAIGPCCYEVSEDVAKQFSAHLPGWQAGKARLDLASINRSQLLLAGLAPANIDAPVYCTRCDPRSRFHSFRRDGQASGRMHAVAGIRN
jgi:YfiH family protein